MKRPTDIQVSVHFARESQMQIPALSAEVPIRETSKHASISRLYLLLNPLLFAVVRFADFSSTVLIYQTKSYSILLSKQQYSLCFFLRPKQN